MGGVGGRSWEDASPSCAFCCKTPATASRPRRSTAAAPARLRARRARPPRASVCACAQSFQGFPAVQHLHCLYTYATHPTKRSQISLDRKSKADTAHSRRRSSCASIPGYSHPCSLPDPYKGRTTPEAQKESGRKGDEVVGAAGGPLQRGPGEGHTKLERIKWAPASPSRVPRSPQLQVRGSMTCCCSCRQERAGWQAARGRQQHVRTSLPNSRCAQSSSMQRLLITPVSRHPKNHGQAPVTGAQATRRAQM